MRILETPVKMDVTTLSNHKKTLLSTFIKEAKEQNVDRSEIRKVLFECISGDYDNLVETLYDNTYYPEINPHDVF